MISAYPFSRLLVISALKSSDFEASQLISFSRSSYGGGLAAIEIEYNLETESKSIFLLDISLYNLLFILLLMLF